MYFYQLRELYELDERISKAAEEANKEEENNVP